MPSNYDLSISAEIRAAMGRANITQHQLAVQIGRNDKYLSRRMQGHTPWRLADLYALADQLGVPVQSLINPQQLKTRAG